MNFAAVTYSLNGVLFGTRNDRPLETLLSHADGTNDDPGGKLSINRFGTAFQIILFRWLSTLLTITSSSKSPLGI